MSQLSFGGDLLQTELVERGYSLVEHGISDDAIDALIQSYANFTDNLDDPSLEIMYAMIKDPNKLDDLAYENDTAKDFHKYRTTHPYVFKPGGYSNRSLQTRALREVGGLELADDPKEFYHFLPNGLPIIEQRHREYGWKPVPPEVTDLHSKFTVIHQMGMRAVQDIFARMEEHHPELLSKVVTRQDLDNSPIRLVVYHPGQAEL